MRHEQLLDQTRAVLVITDMQEAFRKSITDFAETTARIALVAHAAHILGVPIIVTEQYPHGLGRTADELRAVLPHDLEPIEKTAFSSCDSPEFISRLEQTRATQVLLCGLETHICISQTAHDLLASNYQVHLLIDCTSARTDDSKQLGIERMRQSGVHTCTTETALFEFIRDSQHQHFKTIQKLIK